MMMREDAVILIHSDRHRELLLASALGTRRREGGGPVRKRNGRLVVAVLSMTGAIAAMAGAAVLIQGLASAVTLP